MRYIVIHMGGTLVEPEIIDLHHKRIEQSVVGIRAKLADAVEMVRRAKEMAANSENVLIKAQLELEELYIALDTGADQRTAPPLHRAH